MYIYKGDRRRASGSDFWVQEAELSDGEIGGRGLDRFEEQKVLRASATIRSSETRRKNNRRRRTREGFTGFRGLVILGAWQGIFLLWMPALEGDASEDGRGSEDGKSYDGVLKS